MQTPMTYSKNGLALTERFEQCRLVAFWDAIGKRWTLGWGHTAGVVPGMTCTQEQADQWAAEDTEAAQVAINNLVTVQLDQDEFDALVDLQYNCGCLRGSTEIALINQKEYLKAAHFLEQYDHADGKVIAGLLRRRIADESLFLKGVECQLS